MKTASPRLCIFPKDVARITGKSERFGRMLLQKIRQHYGKADHQFVTVDEFCTYTGIQKESMALYLS